MLCVFCRKFYYKIMKTRLLLGFSFFALFGAFIINGCKTTATDPGYVALAEIRFADFHQVQPIKIYMAPKGQSVQDSNKTPTPLTYGIVTPYFTGIETNRDAGKTYILTAVNALTNATVQQHEITLKPGDRYTWVISGGAGTFDEFIISDNPTAPTDT